MGAEVAGAGGDGVEGGGGGSVVVGGAHSFEPFCCGRELVDPGGHLLQTRFQPV